MNNSYRAYSKVYKKKKKTMHNLLINITKNTNNVFNGNHNLNSKKLRLKISWLKLIDLTKILKINCKNQMIREKLVLNFKTN